MPGAILIRDVASVDRDAWFHLWAAYNAFYETSVAPHISERTWQRMLHDEFAKADDFVRYRLQF